MRRRAKSLREGSGAHKGDLGLIPVPERQFMQLEVVPKRNARQGRTEGPPDGVTAGLGMGDRWTEIIPFRWINAKRRSGFLKDSEQPRFQTAKGPPELGGLAGLSGPGSAVPSDQPFQMDNTGGPGVVSKKARHKRSGGRKLSEAGRTPGQGTVRESIMRGVGRGSGRRQDRVHDETAAERGLRVPIKARAILRVVRKPLFP